MGRTSFFYCNPGCGKGFLSGETRTIEETRFVERFPILSCNPEKRSTVETCVKGRLVRAAISGETLTYDECIPVCQTSRHGDTEHRKVIMFSEELPLEGCDSNEVEMTRTCDNATLAEWTYAGVGRSIAALYRQIHYETAYIKSP